MAAALAVGTVAGLSACSDRGDPHAGSTTAAPSGIGSRWGACMRDAGFDVQDPTEQQVRNGAVITPSGVDEGRFHTAADTCSRQLGVERADSAQQDRWTREYAQVASCVREEYPDFPEQEPGVLSVDPEEYPRATEEAFQQRFDTCMTKYSPDTKTQDAG